MRQNLEIQINQQLLQMLLLEEGADSYIFNTCISNKFMGLIAVLEGLIDNPRTAELRSLTRRTSETIPGIETKPEEELGFSIIPEPTQK